MKYSDSNPPLVCMMTQSTCYKGTSQGIPVGILWHDTGAGNPWLKRYVQPDDNASNKEELLKILGKNVNKNDFNHITRQAGLNCWVGKLEDGSVSTVQTMPWTYRPWGCGSGSKGSCNGRKGGPFWIQFEICDDSWNNSKNKYVIKDETYFKAAYKEACEITAYLCKKFNIDPNGTINYNGVKVPTILCHQDSYQLKLGSGHYDIYGWFGLFSKTMVDVRKDVTALLSGQSSTTLSTPSTNTNTSSIVVGDLVSIAKGATYYSGKVIGDWVLSKNWYVKSITDDRVVIDKSEDGQYSIMSPVNIKYLTKVKQEEEAPAFEPYVVRITADTLNVRSGPGIDYLITTTVNKGGVYTIVAEENNWGKLKSGAGWISLKYTKKK